MITEREIDIAIEECLKEPVTGSKRSILADLIIIQNHLFGEPINNGYSYKNEVANIINTEGDTEFLQIVNNKDCEKVLSIIDELMDAIKVLHPRMYDSVLRKIEDL